MLENVAEDPKFSGEMWFYEYDVETIEQSQK